VQQPYPQAMKTIMQVNLELRRKLFLKEKSAVELLSLLVKEFKKFGIKEGFEPVLLWMPQKDDILYIKKKENFYSGFIRSISKDIQAIDVTDVLLKRNDLDELYCDDNEYGGHYSKEGNRVVAQVVYKFLKEKEII